MKIHLIEGLAGLGILFTLSSCGSMQDLSTVEKENTLPVVKGTSSLYRQAEIPLLQVDASAIYRQMLSYVTPVPESPSAPVTQTEQYREVYELAAYRFPSCPEAQLNAAAASLSMGDSESARFFFQSVESDPRSWNNLGVLSLMDGDVPGALSYFRKFIPQNPRLARQNMELAKQLTGDNSVDR